MLKKLVIILFFLSLCALNIRSTIGADEYNPPFELYGIVKEIGEDYLEVYAPYINKEITVKVLADASIIDRVDRESSPRYLGDIKVKDLVVIKGVLGKNSFLGKEISYLSVTK